MINYKNIKMKKLTKIKTKTKIIAKANFKTYKLTYKYNNKKILS